MTLVNVWTRDLRSCLARTVAITEPRQWHLQPVTDLAGHTVRPAETIDGVALTFTNLTPEFQTTIVNALFDGICTIEDEPVFAYIAAEADWQPSIIHAKAVPLLTHMRRSTLPDWYVPDEKFCR